MSASQAGPAPGANPQPRVWLLNGRRPPRPAAAAARARAARTVRAPPPRCAAGSRPGADHALPSRLETCLVHLQHATRWAQGSNCAAHRPSTRGGWFRSQKSLT